MSDDLLSRATRALREETRGDDEGARFTRSRIMASVHEQRVRRRTHFAFLIPIAATLAAASAWGAGNGKLGEVAAAVAEVLGIAEPTPPASPTPPPKTRSLPVTPKVAAPPSPPLADAPVIPPPPPPEPEPQSTPAPVSPKPRAPEDGGASAGGSANSDPSFELYRVAHQAHFVERDSARALAAWDAYLKAAPNASLALEARYNRALCLVRLKRSSEARAALRPFAEGRYGGYRKAEAAELIAALPSELPGPSGSDL